MQKGGNGREGKGKEESNGAERGERRKRRGMKKYAMISECKYAQKHQTREMD